MNKTLPLIKIKFFILLYSIAFLTSCNDGSNYEENTESSNYTSEYKSNTNTEKEVNSQHEEEESNSNFESDYDNNQTNENNEIEQSNLESETSEKDSRQAKAYHNLLTKKRPDQNCTWCEKTVTNNDRRWVISLTGDHEVSEESLYLPGQEIFCSKKCALKYRDLE